MKFTLKGYQEDAVHDVLANLRKARRRWREENDRHAFSLAATTGAGKTVMAAAAFEALFYGNDDADFEPDAGAVVIWFSDDPALNEQTRFRLLECSDRLKFSDLVVVQNTFSREKFEPGKIYFLNTQKLSRNSLLVRGHESDDDAAATESSPDLRPDLRSHTIWDTIRNTVEDSQLTLYLVLDEAHRGMGNISGASQAAKSTLVKRLINGAGAVPPIPIVWGISATVERFNAAMAGAEGRGTLPNVVVDSKKVQASGLLKDTLILDIPKEAGHFDSVLVRRATDKLRESAVAWREYATQQGDPNVVKPLMILQVPNTPDPSEIGRALDACLSQWDELKPDAFAHVFGEHTPLTFGRHVVPYLSPERVQEADWVRVLIAKDAISTGWDCPRAEVLVSFRPAKDRTHITQLLGRMVRAPLARRIPGSERLNSVDCLLPFFDKQSVEAVADVLLTGSGEGDDASNTGRRVLINPKEMTPNSAIPDSVWEKFLSLPAQALPPARPKPTRRLTALAQELAADGLLPNAGKKAHAEMHKALDAAQERYSEDVAAARISVSTVVGSSLTADLTNKAKTFEEFSEAADYQVIHEAFKRAARLLSPDIARTYAEYVAKGMDGETPEDKLLGAYAQIAALGLVSQVKTYLDAEADKLAMRWLEQYRVQVKSLPDDRQDVYRHLRSMSADPAEVDLVKPKSWLEPTVVREANGTETPIETFKNHLLSDQDGNFPVEMNTWERQVLQTEMQRPGFLAWYRNPARATQDSLGIVYSSGRDSRLVRPDFIVFGKTAEGTVVADIVDPHGTQFSDALPKLQGLARYAERYGSAYRRVEAVAKVGEQLRALDLKDPEVRAAVSAAGDAKGLYVGPLSTTY